MAVMKVAAASLLLSVVAAMVPPELTVLLQSETQSELGAIVTPFIHRDIPTILASIDSWNDVGQKVQPCTSAPQQRADWIFYYNNDKNATMEDQLMAAFQKNSNVRSCFGSIVFMYANLTGEEDRYPFGPSNMFYRGMPLLQKYGYVFYMEADCKPIRNNWLTKLQEACGGPVEPFWIKGSIVRGANQPSHDFTGRFFHINGNAFYATGSEGFQNLIKTVHAWNEQKGTMDGAWDTEIARYLTDEENWEFARQNAAKFHFTDLIQNYWQSPYSKKQLLEQYPWTYIVHGGMAQE